MPRMGGCVVADKRLSLDDRLGRSWPLHVIDGLIAAGIVRDDDLDGLSGVQLAALASDAVAHVLRDWDPRAAIASVPQPRPRAAA